MKRKKLGLGTKIIHEECPRCACARIASGTLSNDEIVQELSNLTSLYSGLSQELEGHSRIVKRIQVELECLTEHVQEQQQDEGQEQEHLNTQHLESLIEEAIPRIVKELTESQEQQAPPSNSAEELSLLRENLAELQSRFGRAREEGKQAIVAAMTGVIRQVNELEIKHDTNQQALLREVEEIRAELVLVRRSLSCLPNQGENNSGELANPLLRRLSSIETKLTEQDKINRREQEFNQDTQHQQAETKGEVEKIKRQQEEIKRDADEAKRQVDSLRQILEDNQDSKPSATVGTPGTVRSTNVSETKTSSGCNVSSANELASLLNGDDIDSTDEDGMTALHRASKDGQQAVVDVLLIGGASVDMKYKDGWTALHVASMKGHEGVVDKLSEAAGRSKRQTVAARRWF